MLVGVEKDTLSLEEREEVEREKNELQSRMLSQWVGTGIDALLMPVLPWVGYKPKTWVKSSQWVGYTAMWNLLDYAGVTVPVGRADRELDSGDGEWEAYVGRNESDEFNREQCEYLIRAYFA